MVSMVSGITELALVILFAAGLGILAKLLKQPIILAYLAAGVLIGYFGFFHFGDREIFQVFSNLGIMFLLFLVGLEINYTSLRLVGGASLLIGLGQIFFTALFGFLIASLFGFNTLASLYIAITLTFSSTIIIVQLLSEKKALNSLYGKISVGFLLVQDFVAILILIFLAGIEKGGVLDITRLFLTTIEGVLLFVTMLFLGRKLFPYLFDRIAHSRELLFLSSLAWLFAVAALVDQIGFSIEIGGFLAGLALANSAETFEISSRFRPLRDFFILVFFVILGSSMVFADFSGLILAIIVFSVFVLVGNPLIVMVVMGLMGYERRTSFMAGITVAQISEFSLIVANLGARLGHISSDVVALITAVGVVTITTSTYLIVNSDRIFKLVSPYLRIFERKRIKKDTLPKAIGRPIIIFGFHRTGSSIATHLDKKDMLIIDFDPEVIKRLREQGYNFIFGDVSDFEIFEKIDFDKVDVVISTSPAFEDNMELIPEVRRRKKEVKIIVRAENDKEARMLYNAGADYVLMPQFISGHYLSHVLNNKEALENLKELKKRDLALLNHHK